MPSPKFASLFQPVHKTKKFAHLARFRPRLEGVEERCLLSAYSATILADNPVAYWRLGEAAGTAAVDSSPNGNGGTYVGAGISLGAAGALVADTDKAVTFSGAANTGVTLPPVPFGFGTSTTTSFEVWFKINPGQGGVILGQVGGAGVLPGAGTFSGWVPGIYIDTAGVVRAEMFWHGSVGPIQSSPGFNDGQYHHLVNVFNAGTETLYIDGNQVASGGPGLIQSAYAGGPANYSYYLGAGFTSSWPGGNGGWFFLNGTLDEAALYNTALTATQVQNHFATGKNSAPVVDLNGVTAGNDNVVTYNTPTDSLIAASGTITDAENNNIISMTAVLTSRPDGDMTETLTFDSSALTAAMTAGLSAIYTSANGTLSVAGISSLATYQTILQGILYQNLSPTPDSTPRTVTVVVNDGDPSTSRTSTVLINPGVPATLVVDHPIDENDGNFSAGDLSLREAIYLSNLNPDANTITFDPSLNGGTLLLDGGIGALPAISGNLTIQGLGADLLTVQRPASNPQSFGIFTINAGVTATISGLTITGGRNLTSDGGAIENLGNLTLQNSIITGNAVTSATRMTYGGGVDNQGALTIDGCVFSNNSATSTFPSSPYGYGGAIANRYVPAQNYTVTITNSTFSNNSAYVGGVIDSYGIVTITGSTLVGNQSVGNGAALENRIGAQMTLTNSTLTQNTTQANGGGIRNLGTLTVRSSTISGNTASVGGGGISQQANYGSTTVTSTIVSGNTAATAPDIQAPPGRPVTANFCLLENISGTSFSGTSANNLTGLDPLLGSLQDNGGPTQTMALAATSPALDMGSNPASLTSDQRGSLFTRTSGLGTDIGAFEFQPPTVTGINPTSGPTTGGTSVVITGTNLGSVTAVNFGGTPATSFTIDSATQITAVSPSQAAGTVDVTATNPDGTSATSAADRFTYLTPTTVTLISSANPSVFGQSVTFTATVTPVGPGSGTPTGTVTWSIDGGPGTSVPLNGSGAAALTTSTLTVGTHTVSATYSGDAFFSAQTTSLPGGQTVTQGTSQFDFQPALSSPLQAGSIAVLPGTNYTAARGYGWTKTPWRTTDAGPLPSLAGNPLAFQLRDYMSDFGGLSSAGIFRVDFASADPVQITTFLGDASGTLDGIEVAFSTNGTTYTPFTPGGGLAIPAGKFTSVTTSAVIPGVVGETRSVWIRIQDLAGSTSNWSASGLAVRAVGSVGALGVTPSEGSVPADGLTVDTYTVTGAAPGAVLNITASLGTILTDARTELLGNQVIADGTGMATFQVRRPFVNGNSTITVSDFTGAATRTITQTYDLVTNRKFDMNAGTPSLPDASSLDVRSTSLYSAAAGYGWTTAPSAADLGTYPAGSTVPQQALYRDYHSGTGTNTFKVYVGAFCTVNVKIYRYTPSLNTAGMTVSLEGGAFQPMVGNSTTFPATAGADGILDITFKAAMFANWAVNGIEVS